MFTIPLSLFAIIYLVLLAVLLVFLLVILHHYVATGTMTVVAFAVSFLVIASCIIVLYLTLVGATDINWTKDIVFFEDGFNIGIPGF